MKLFKLFGKKKENIYEKSLRKQLQILKKGLKK